MGTGAQQGLRQVGARRGEVLAVVQHQQEPPVPEGVDQRGDQRAVGLFADVERGGRRLRHESRLRERRELDEPDPIRERLHQVPRYLQCQPGLPAAARSRERHQAMILQQGMDLGDLLLPSDEAGERQGQVVSRNRQRGRRWKPGGTCRPAARLGADPLEERARLRVGLGVDLAVQQDS
jgi:hypothetical protein